VNTGEGGMSLESAIAMKVGEPVDVEFSLPSIDRQLRLAGKIHRFTPPDRYELEIVHASDADREAMQDYIAGGVHVPLQL
jgi:hypothetical protein